MENLHDKDRRSYAVFQRSPLAMVLLDPMGRVLQANSAFEQLFGYNSQELRDMDYYVLGREDDREAAVDSSKRLCSGEILNYKEDRRYMTRSGEILYLRINADMIFDESGRPDFVLVVLHDVSDKYQERQERLSSDRLIRALLDSIVGAVFVLDRGGRIAALNGEAAATLGRPQESLVGLDVFAFAQKQYAEVRRRQLEEVFESGRMARLEGEREGMPHELLAYPVFSERGQVERVAVLARDLSSARRSARMLAQSEARFRLLFEACPEPTVIVDSTNSVVCANSAAQAVLGHGQEGLVGGPSPVEFVPGDVGHFSKGQGQLVRDYEVRSVPVSLDGDTSYMVTLRDITHHIRAVEQFRDISMLDDLTQLYNRRGFFALARQQLALVKRSGRRATIFFADLDGLKGINDYHGHLEGDRALTCMSDVLRRTFRRSDVIARIGGDEFAVLAVDIGLDSQFPIEKRLCEIIDETNRSIAAPWRLSVSCGSVSTEQFPDADFETMLKLADQIMYTRKVCHR